jgi:hypothetical protein
VEPPIAPLSSAIIVCQQGANGAISCAQKLIVVLTIDSGDAVANKELNFQLACVGR